MPLRGQKIVLLGGGHSHALLLLQLTKYPHLGPSVTLVSDHETSIYSGMLPGHLAGFYPLDALKIDLRALCLAGGVEFVLGQAYGIDHEKNRVHCSDGVSIPFDILSIDIGSISSIPDSLTKHRSRACPIKPFAAFFAQWDLVKKSVTTATTPVRICVVGGGSGGVELALAMKASLGNQVAIQLIHSGQTVLDSYGRRARTLAHEALTSGKIALLLGTMVKAAADHEQGVRLHLDGGSMIDADFVFLATKASAPSWLRQTDLELTDDGFIAIRPTLQSRSHLHIFAAGDIATLMSSIHPKAGVYAVRQAPVLLQNLKAILQREPLASYKPQPRFLSLLNMCDGTAIASYGPFSGRSSWYLKLKMRIDSRFVAKFRRSPKK